MKYKFSASLIYVLPLTLIFIAAELIFGMNYPMFRDEFYYLDCANHLSPGYVDHPGFSIFILFIWKTIFGTSLLSVRILPALTGAVLILLTSKITEEIGGSKTAQVLSAAAVFCVPTFLVMGGFYSMNSFDVLFWAIIFYLLLKIINTNNSKLWIWFGIAAGLGLMNKISVLYLGAGIAGAMIFTKERNWFKNKFFWIGGIIALLIFSPYIIWNIQNDFATLEFIQNATKFKNANIPLLEFSKEQFMQVNPFNFFIWFTGLAALIFSASMKKYRVIGFAYIIIFIILAAQKSKPYYLAAAYPVLISAGAAAISGFFESKKSKFVPVVYAVIILAFTTLISPLFIPVYPPDKLISFMDKIGYKPNTGEKIKQTGMPQYFADRFGWEEMAEKVARAYNSLSSEEKKHASIYCGNYGEAGAINYYGKKYGLPESLSGHNSHYLWGPPAEDSVNILIVVGQSKEDVEKSFNDIVLFDNTSSVYSMPYENGRPVFICRGIKRPLKLIWPDVKLYI